MDKKTFFGRENELKFLQKAYQSDKAEMIVLYGRRRVGKTELLKEFCQQKPSVFYSCRKYTDQEQLRNFSKALLKFSNGKHYTSSFESWDNAFSFIESFPQDKKTIIVIDEFPYACNNNSALPSILQIAWDSVLSNCNVMLVICGSSMSFIEDELLSEKNPLYGRATGIYKMLPMPYYDAVKFLPTFPVEDKLVALSILGGIPHYLKQFNPNLSLKDNIVENILSKGTVLYSEVEFLLHEELRETSVYNTIIQAIALGNSSFNEILVRTEIEKSKLSVYLKKLLELNILEKELSALSKDKDKTNSSKGSYILTDNFFRFWFAYAYPNFSLLEMEGPLAVWEDFIQNNLHNFSSKSFEKICIEYMFVLNKNKKLPFRFTNIARWWGKVTKPDGNGKLTTTSEEIDILASDSNQKNYIIGECKFTNEPFDLKQLKKLQNKITFNGNIYYYLFSLNGFTDAVKELANKETNIFLVSATDIMSAL